MSVVNLKELYIHCKNIRVVIEVGSFSIPVAVFNKIIANHLHGGIVGDMLKIKVKEN